MQAVNDWLVIGVVVVVLAVFWQLLNLTFDLLDTWHARADLGSRAEDSPPRKGKVI
jgi:hypothetical protein